MFRRIILAAIILLMVVVLPACGGYSVQIVSLFNTVNIGRIKTVLKEDGSGYNIFWLVVPSGCPFPALKSRLESISKPTVPLVRTLHNELYKDYRVDGFEVIYNFENVDQIPVQIENIKGVVIDAAVEALEARLDAIPTPEPDSGIPPPPEIRPGDISSNSNHLSVLIHRPAEKLTGQEWNVEVIVNPFLMTGLITENASGEGLSESCSLPSFTYELELSGNMKINGSHVEAQPPILASPPYSQVTQVATSNSIEWTIDSRRGFDVWKKAVDEELEVKSQEFEKEFQRSLETTPTPSASEIESASESYYKKIMEIYDSAYNRQVYKLNVNVTTPAPWFHFLTGVFAPLLGLISLILGLLLTIKNFRKKGIVKRSENEDPK
jgi:hypothetical protein